MTMGRTAWSRSDAIEHYVEQMRRLAEVGSSLCCYMPGAGDPEQWPGSRCDCKMLPTIFGSHPRLGSEQTGCVEVRLAYYAMARLHNEAMMREERGPFV